MSNINFTFTAQIFYLCIHLMEGKLLHFSAISLTNLQISTLCPDDNLKLGVFTRLYQKKTHTHNFIAKATGQPTSYSTFMQTTTTTTPDWLKTTMLLHIAALTTNKRKTFIHS